MGLIDTISRRRGPARRQAGGGHHAGLLRAFGALTGPALAGAATLAIAFGAGADDPRSPARNLPALPQATACLAGAFLPNPVASSGDAALLFSLFRLQREVQDVSLPARLRITDGQLADDWVRLVSDSGGAYLDGATCGDLGFDWTDPRFAYVTAYATLARTADWAIATGLEDALPRALTVQVSETRPDSRYDADTRRLQLGSRQCGDVACRCDPDQGQCPIASDGRTIWPDAQDGDVVVHEYGHAILHHVLCADQPGCRLPRGRFVPVLDEAFADYLAVASAPGQKTDALCLGEWFYAVEGGTGPCLRWLDATAPWPESARGLAAEQPYSYATLWTSALLRARAALPEGVMDRIVVAAYRHLPDNRTPEQLAAQVVAEAQDAGRDAQATIASILTEAGFLDIRAPEAPEIERAGIEIEADALALEVTADRFEPGVDPRLPVRVVGSKLVDPSERCLILLGHGSSPGPNELFFTRPALGDHTADVQHDPDHDDQWDADKDEPCHTLRARQREDDRAEYRRESDEPTNNNCCLFVCVHRITTQRSLIPTS